LHKGMIDYDFLTHLRAVKDNVSMKKFAQAPSIRIIFEDNHNNAI
jgi:hypothetical protein